MQTCSDYQPKLSWFHTLHEAFSSGTIKSFVKTPKKDRKTKMNIQIEYDEDEDVPNDESMTETQYEIKEMKTDDSESTLIFTQYEEEQFEPMEETQEISLDNNQHEIVEIHHQHNESTSSSSKSPSSLSSNQLFLNSLLSTFEKLPDDKNMKARIKIQEILYKIAYDID
jgi:hypothetical protein